MIVYPSNLPSPLVRAYSAQDSQLFVRDDVSLGPIVYALDSIDSFTVFDASFGLNGKEKEAFTNFVEVTLSDRSRSFEIELDNQGETITALCYMTNVNYSSVGKRWNASTELIMVKVVEAESTPDYSPIETASNVWDMDTNLPTILVDEGYSSDLVSLTFLGDINVTQASLRADATGNSIGFPVQGVIADSWLQNVTTRNTFFSHFTIEAIFKFDTEQANGNDRSCIGIYTPEFGDDGGFLNLTADNFNTGIGTNNYPVITLRTEGEYNTSAQNGVVVAEARSSTAVILGNTYHLLGTFNAITRTLYLYVNGVLADEITLTQSQYNTWLGTGDNSLQNSLRENRKVFRVGKRPVGSTTDAIAQSGLVDNALLHNGVYMPAGQAAQQATIAAYT